MTSFKELLKKKSFKVLENNESLLELGKNIITNKVEEKYEKAITTKVLGEWMWKAWRENLDRGTFIESYLKKLGYKPYNEFGAMRYTFNHGIARAEVCIEIAIECLGESEVKKRLEEIK